MITQKHIWFWNIFFRNVIWGSVRNTHETFIFQVIAFICGTIVVVLMIMALASTEWLMSDGWRQGLFAHCIGEKAPKPLPFNIDDPPDCYAARDVGTYRLCIVTNIWCEKVSERMRLLINFPLLFAKRVAGWED